MAKAIASGRIVEKDLISLMEIEAFAQPHQDNSLSLTRPGAAQPGSSTYCEDPFTIPFVVTVLDEDRDGDVVVPRGCHLKNYARNPIWFFGHQEWVIPIGVSKNLRGDKLLVWPEDSVIRAACRFDSSDEDAMYIHDKVKNGFLNATSIAFVPIEAYRRETEIRRSFGAYDKAEPHKNPNAPPGWIFKQYDLTEISIVGVPSNANAIRDSLDREKSFISPRLQKGLRKYAASAAGVWGGWGPSTATEKTHRPAPNKVEKDRPSQPDPYHDQEFENALDNAEDAATRGPTYRAPTAPPAPKSDGERAASERNRKQREQSAGKRTNSSSEKPREKATTPAERRASLPTNKSVAEAEKSKRRTRLMGVTLEQDADPTINEIIDEFGADGDDNRVNKKRPQQVASLQARQRVDAEDTARQKAGVQADMESAAPGAGQDKRRAREVENMQRNADNKNNAYTHGDDGLRRHRQLTAARRRREQDSTKSLDGNSGAAGGYLIPKNCGSCAGDGNCEKCGGDGEVMKSYCAKCSGSGCCRKCGGRGVEKERPNLHTADDEVWNHNVNNALDMAQRGDTTYHPPTPGPEAEAARRAAYELARSGAHKRPKKTGETEEKAEHPPGTRVRHTPRQQDRGKEGLESGYGQGRGLQDAVDTDQTNVPEGHTRLTSWAGGDNLIAPDREIIPDSDYLYPAEPEEDETATTPTKSHKYITEKSMAKKGDRERVEEEDDDAIFSAGSSEEEGDDDKYHPDKLKHGARILASLHDHANSEHDYLHGKEGGGELSKLDNPALHADLMKYHEKHLGGRRDHVHGLLGKHYPDHDMGMCCKALTSDGGGYGSQGEDNEVEHGNTPDENRLREGETEEERRRREEEEGREGEDGNGGESHTPGSEESSVPEILERYQDKGGRWHTRKAGVLRKSKSGRHYLVKDIRQQATGDAGTSAAGTRQVKSVILNPDDGANTDPRRPLAAGGRAEEKGILNPGDETPISDEWLGEMASSIASTEKFLDGMDDDDDVPDARKKSARMCSKGLFGVRKSLVIKGGVDEAPMEITEKFMDEVADDSQMKKYKSAAREHSKQLYGVRKSLSHMGKLQRSGGSGSTLTDEGTAGNRGSMKDAGQRQANGGDQRAVSKAIEERFEKFVRTVGQKTGIKID